MVQANLGTTLYYGFPSSGRHVLCHMFILAPADDQDCWARHHWTEAPLLMDALVAGVGVPLRQLGPLAASASERSNHRADRIFNVHEALEKGSGPITALVSYLSVLQGR